MAQYMVTTAVTCIGDLTDFDERTDSLFEALDGMHGVTDPDLSATLDTGQVEICMIVDADDEIAAAIAALSNIRTAIHGIGDGTPGWEHYIAELSTSARPLEMASAGS